MTSHEKEGTKKTYLSGFVPESNNVTIELANEVAGLVPKRAKFNVRICEPERGCSKEKACESSPKGKCTFAVEKGAAMDHAGNQKKKLSGTRTFISVKLEIGLEQWDLNEYDFEPGSVVNNTRTDYAFLTKGVK